MIRGLYTSGLGMMKETKRLDVISNNLANASTNAFKSSGVTSGNFAKALSDVQVGRSKINIENYTPDAVNTYTNYTQGSLNNTSNKTDLAITGDNHAFFEVENDKGELLYTRDGSFSINKDGYLVTDEGYKVLGNKGYINLKNNEIGISVKGEITDANNNLLIDTLAVKSFENPETLSKMGDNFVKANETTTMKDFEGEIQQGYLEMSNVNTVNEMVNMISVTRSYEANQKVLQAQDEMLGKAVSDVGKV